MHRACLLLLSKQCVVPVPRGKESTSMASVYAFPEAGFVSWLFRILNAMSMCICFETKTKLVKQSFVKLFLSLIFVLLLLQKRFGESNPRLRLLTVIFSETGMNLNLKLEVFAQPTQDSRKSSITNYPFRRPVWLWIGITYQGLSGYKFVRRDL